MRRKKNNKRVLVSPRDTRRQPQQRTKRRNNYNNKPKRNNKTLLIMVIALVAFVIGAGIGVSLSLDDGQDEEVPQFENVTKEMTTNLNDTEPVYFEKNVDDVDFNDNRTQAEMNVTEETLNY